MRRKSKIYEILRQYDNRNFQIEPSDKKIHTKEEAIKQIKALVIDNIPKSYEAPALHIHELSDAQYQRQIGFNLAVGEMRKRLEVL